MWSDESNSEGSICLSGRLPGPANSVQFFFDRNADVHEVRAVIEKAAAELNELMTEVEDEDEE